MFRTLLIEQTGNAFYDFFINIANFFIDPSIELNALQRILLAIVFIVVSHFVIKFVCFVLKKIFKIKKQVGIQITLKSFIVGAIRVCLYVFVAFLVVSLLGIDISSFAGVLSAVTVALGLAIQDIIGAFASGILLLSEKCFKLGDHIEIVNTYGTCEGEVQKVGLLLTKIKTFDGEMIFVTNNTVTKSNMTNFTYFNTRRLVVNIPLPFDVDIDKAKEIMFKVLEEDKRVLKDPIAKVALVEFKEFSYVFGLRIWSKVADYWDLYYDIKEELVKALKANGINLPAINTITINK